MSTDKLAIKLMDVKTNRKSTGLAMELYDLDEIVMTRED